MALIKDFKLVEINDDILSVVIPILNKHSFVLKENIEKELLCEENNLTDFLEYYNDEINSNDDLILKSSLSSYKINQNIVGVNLRKGIDFSTLKLNQDNSFVIFLKYTWNYRRKNDDYEKQNLEIFKNCANRIKNNFHVSFEDSNKLIVNLIKPEDIRIYEISKLAISVDSEIFIPISDKYKDNEMWVSGRYDPAMDFARQLNSEIRKELFKIGIVLDCSFDYKHILYRFREFNQNKSD
jgi:hypothetical protein